MGAPFSRVNAFMAAMSAALAAGQEWLWTYKSRGHGCGAWGKTHCSGGKTYELRKELPRSQK